MATKTERQWQIKDADSNVLGVFEGTADSTWVGRELIDGSIVASVEQLADVVEEDTDHAPIRHSETIDTLQKQLEALTLRVTALENA